LVGKTLPVGDSSMKQHLQKVSCRGVDKH